MIATGVLAAFLAVFAVGIASIAPPFFPIAFSTGSFLIVRAQFDYDSHRLRLYSDALELASKYKKRRIPYADVRTIWLRSWKDEHGEHSLIELVKQDFDSLILHDHYQDFDRLIDVLCARMPDARLKDDRGLPASLTGNSGA